MEQFGRNVSLYPLSIIDLKSIMAKDSGILQDDSIVINHMKLDDIVYIVRSSRYLDILRGAIRIKIGKMEQAPASDHAWLTYWVIVDLIRKKPVGLIGFEGLREDGSAEISFATAPEFEGRGYATDAVTTLIKWAFANDSCVRITATDVLKNNEASLKVLKKSGFKKISHTKETDSYVYEKKC